jgi:membrane protein
VATPIERARAYIERHLWSSEPLEPAPLGWLRSLVQLAIVIGEGFVKDQLLLRAHSLTYLSLLALVPLLALAVTIVGLVGGSDVVLEWIVDQITAGSPGAKEHLLPMVERMDFRALGPLSGGLLIGSTVLAVGAAERALNAVWGVTEQRPWSRRVPDYLAVLVVAPLMLGIAIPLGTGLQSQWLVQRALELPGFEVLYTFGLRQLPTLLITLGFCFVYWFLPNTRVPAGSALLGGLVGSLLFAVAQSLYVTLQVGVAKYDAIFGAIASLPLLMVWLYVSWAIVLLGAEVAYARQTLPLFRREVRGAPAGSAARETIGLSIALACARVFREGGAPWTAEALSDELDVPLRTVRDVLRELSIPGILSPCGGSNVDAFQLGRPMEQIRVADVLLALRGTRDAGVAQVALSRAVEKALAQVDEAAAAPAVSCNLRDLTDRLLAGVDPPEGAS